MPGFIASYGANSLLNQEIMGTSTRLQRRN